MRRTCALTYGWGCGIMATMTEAHPSVAALRQSEKEYAKAVARLAAAKAARLARRTEHRNAMIQAIMDNPDMTHVDIASRYGVSEGSIRNLRRELTASQ